MSYNIHPFRTCNSHKISIKTMNFIKEMVDMFIFKFLHKFFKIRVYSLCLTSAFVMRSAYFTRRIKALNQDNPKINH